MIFDWGSFWPSLKAWIWVRGAYGGEVNSGGVFACKSDTEGGATGVHNESLDVFWSELTYLLRTLLMFQF